MLSAYRRFSGTDSSGLLRTSVVEALCSSVASPLGHREDHAESRAARHHAPIRLFGPFQRKSFDHGPNVSEYAEIKSVLGLDRSSCQASADRAATKNQRNSVDRNWIA